MPNDWYSELLKHSDTGKHIPSTIGLARVGNVSSALYRADNSFSIVLDKYEIIKKPNEFKETLSLNLVKESGKNKHVNVKKYDIIGVLSCIPNNPRTFEEYKDKYLCLLESDGEFPSFEILATYELF